MQFIDLNFQQQKIKDKIDANIQNVLAHGKYILGPEVKELEQKLAEYAGVEYAIGVASGTDALLMPLMVNDVGPNDAIFTVSFTFIATAEVIKLLGATPVFVDIEPDTFNIDVNKLEEAIEKVKKEGKLNLKGIIPVDLFGQPADYDEINAIAKKYGMFVLEDAAQGFGGSYKGKKTCSLTDIGATSFFPAKPLGTYGDGGMCFTNDKEIYDRLLSIRVHGKGSHKYDNVRVGINGRLDTLMAAILLAKFEIFNEEINLRQNVANRYSEKLDDVVKTPFVKDHNISAWAQYSILHPDREKVMAGLKEDGIPTAIYYPKPLHLQDAFADLGYKYGDLPVSEKMAAEIFSIPMYPYLNENNQDKIVESIKKNA
ncbi:MAG: DegT/DnrJ/EryC1/StrS aminotransferase family protein [Bacteroidetes bacterium]|nr:DegT/DnrJ/EryC1/StrS aminotransferase family protein [Bacteroidota bacterium]MBL7105145.1 DegT/DnrJ/EryC1/StrS aminotransferase family protein [Bacteroidales bacterium]